MDTRLIAVLTDLDLAEYHLRKKDYTYALSVASVALINAVDGHKLCEVGTPEFDAWEDAVHRAFAVKGTILDAQPD